MQNSCVITCRYKIFSWYLIFVCCSKVNSIYTLLLGGQPDKSPAKEMQVPRCFPSLLFFTISSCISLQQLKLLRPLDVITGTYLLSSTWTGFILIKQAFLWEDDFCSIDLLLAGIYFLFCWNWHYYLIDKIVYWWICAQTQIFYVGSGLSRGRPSIICLLQT